jgi:PAS domain S-box-containing protein
MGEGEEAELRTRIADLEARLRVVTANSDVLEGVLAAVPAIVMRLDADFRMRDISRLATGFVYDEVVGADFFDNVPQPERPRLRAIFERVLATGRAEHYHTVGPGDEGRLSAYDSYVARVTSSDGSLGLVVVAIDVSERLEREKALAASEETSRLAVEVTGVGLWSFEVATETVTWNEAMHRLCGVDTPLDLPTFLDTLIHPEDREEARLVAELGMQGDGFQTPAQRIVRPDGEIRWVVTTGRILRDACGMPERIIGSTLDVTAERLIEERLRQSQRLESVGQLAAGVAHNFNNILASIVPVLEVIKGHVPDRYRFVVEGASHSAGRAAELVRQLLAFAGRRSELQRSSSQLARVAESATSLCRRVLDGRIELSVEDRSEGVRVRCDAGAIEQAIVNLVLNARDAIVDTGRGYGRIRIEVVKDEEHNLACVRVTDDGVGMSAEVARRIFEPFFTTKDVGRGTGLGLAITYATLRDHDGSVMCSSEPGRGSTFELRLPIDSSHVLEEEAQVTLDPSYLPTHRVLLVEDDPRVGEAVAFLLRDIGHEPILARDTAAALELAAADPEVALVLLDRALPGGPGDMIIPRLREILPDARIVFFTGEDVDEIDRARVDAVLSKPATRAELAALLEETVGSAR